jgi:LmbE family N-acetylglucosaminyl deacetylase
MLAKMRAEEISQAMALLGIPHHEFLGYRDSGMMGTDANDHLDSFWRADFIEATARLVHLIRVYRPEVMTVYDPFGGYGHSDLARFPLKDGEDVWEPAKLYWTAWPRSRMRGFAEARKAAGLISDEEYAELKDAGTPDEDITCWMDVSRLFERKEAALRAHRTQIPDDWFLLSIPDEFKSEFFGREAFVRIFSRVDAPRRETDLFTGLR